MIKRLTYLFLLLVICSCNQASETSNKTEESSQKTSKSITEVERSAPIFNYEDFLIKKGQLGEIKIGMTISEAEQKFEGLRKEEGHATSFGYGGGGPAYLYYDQENVVFGLIPTLSSDTILFIISASPKLGTINGLNPNSTAGAILEKYPNIKVNQDLLNGWEYISDTINNWEFVFWTDEITIGDYPKLEVPSNIKNVDIKAGWITIK